ncbi:MAG: phage tail sheath C-terminal domain-containing protein [Sphingorhabdus sp.]
MPMPGIEFTTQAPKGAELSSRADVAMFVGLISRRVGALPDKLASRLKVDGWTEEGVFKLPEGRLEKLLGVPVAAHSWAEFDALYDWKSRPTAPGSADLIPCPLGLSVQQFFRQGGAKAYIVRTGDPVPLADPDSSAGDFLAAKLAAISNSDVLSSAEAIPILPGYDGAGKQADSLDPATWLGAAAIFAVPDAAMLLLPDIVDLCSGAPRIDPPFDKALGADENFRPCAPPAPHVGAEPRVSRPAYLAPRLDIGGFRRWSGALRYAVTLLSRPKGPAHRRDVILVNAMPLPAHVPELGTTTEFSPLELLANPQLGNPGGTDPAPMFGESVLGSRYLQLGYPWLRTAEAQNCPEGLQSPDGALAGMIARTSLSDGAFRSAAGRNLRGSIGLYPQLAGSDLAKRHHGNSDWLGERLCLFGVRAEQLELISDSTMAENTLWRTGGVSRLMGIILRASRYLGDDLLFEPSGSALWNRLRNSMEQLFERLRALGAFSGASRDEAYLVRCDRSTMTQNDIDAGRVICQISFSPAYPIERITVTLALLDAPAILAEAA